MIARILPPDEWSRLIGKGLDTLLPHLRPEDSRLVVVEVDGEIVAHLGVLRVTHFEGLWLAPGVRGNPAVGRRLLETAWAAAQPWADSWVMAQSADEQIRDLVTRLGGVRIPVESFIMRFGGN